MKKMTKWLWLVLALVLLLTACSDDTGRDRDRDDGEDTGPSINYEDFIDPVVDRKVSDCITTAELAALMQVEEVSLVLDTDAEASYQSADGYYMVTLGLANMTRAEFDTMVSDATVWTAQDGLGEAAYWGVDQTELVAYQDGYAVSVSGYHVYYGCLQSIMERVLENL